MDLSTVNLDDLIPKLEEKRISLNMSYQNVADCCNVSQRTVMRFFKRESEPQLSLVQSVIAALNYEYAQAPTAPDAYTPEGYADYLKSIIAFEREDKRIRIAKQEARHNRQQSENRRVIVVLGGIIAVAVAALLIDLAISARIWHEDFKDRSRGWITDTAVCPYCHEEILESDTYCSHCGTQQ